MTGDYKIKLKSVLHEYLYFPEDGTLNYIGTCRPKKGGFMSRVKRLETEVRRLVERLERSIEGVNNRIDIVHRLACPHKRVEFENEMQMDSTYSYYSKCKQCGNKVEWFNSEVEWQKAKIEYEQNVLMELEKATK